MKSIKKRSYFNKERSDSVTRIIETDQLKLARDLNKKFEFLEII